MVLKAKTVQRKEPVPVLLTGKTWTPGLELPVEKTVSDPATQARNAKILSYVVGALLGLVISFLILTFTGDSPAPVVPGPVADATATTGSATTPIPAAIIASASQTASQTNASSPLVTALIATPSKAMTAQPNATSPQMLTAKPVASAALQIAVVPVSNASIPVSPSSQTQKRPASQAAVLSEPAPKAKPLPPAEETKPSRVVSTAEPSEPLRDQDVSGIPSLKRRATTLLALRGVLQADGWKITWVSHKKGVRCSNAAGETLSITPGKRRVVFAGRTINASIAPEVTKSGQLFVPIDLLNKILNGRLSIVDRESSTRELTIRLASVERQNDLSGKVAEAPRHAARELKGVSVIKRNGRILVCLRQVLEADGWTIEWKNMKGGAICRKGDEKRLVVIPGRTRVSLGTRTIRTKPYPRTYRGRLHVAVATLDTILNGRLSLRNIRLKAHATDIRLAEG